MKFSNHSINLIMHHYVKNYDDKKTFNLKALDIKKFDKQAIYFKKKYVLLNNNELC